MILAVASGKGGTGKTRVAVNLTEVSGSHVQLLDCDVAAPNGPLHLKGSSTKKETVSVPITQEEF